MNGKFHLKIEKALPVVIFIVCVISLAILFMHIFRQLPNETTTLGLDWRTIWTGIKNGTITYGNLGETIGGMYTPPPGILFLLPFGYLPFKESWGLLAFISILILIISVPKTKAQKLDWLAIFLLVLSYPSLRNIADGNLEAFVVVAVVLMLKGYARNSPIIITLGLLLATIKIQETWLLIIVFSLYVIWKWPKKKWLPIFFSVAFVTIGSMLMWGKPWLEAILSHTNQANNIPGIIFTTEMGRGSIIDITLSSCMQRLGFASWITSCLWLLLFISTGLIVLLWFKRGGNFTKILSALLLSSGILLAPYVSGNSFLVLVAIGLIPLFQYDKIIGSLMLALTYLPYLASQQILYHYQSYYWTFLSILFLFIAIHKLKSALRIKIKPQ